MFKLCITGDLGFEFWKDIPEYEGLYQASTYGRIKSIKRYGTQGGILHQSCYKGGYMSCYLSINGNGKTTSSHKLVSVTFLPKWKPYYSQINHKDENKSNNRVDNLEWCTASYNCNYGGRLDVVSKKLTNRKDQSKPVVQYNFDGVFLNKYDSLSEVERLFGFKSTFISLCCKGAYKQAYGYKWEYA